MYLADMYCYGKDQDSVGVAILGRKRRYVLKAQLYAEPPERFLQPAIADACAGIALIVLGRDQNRDPQRIGSKRIALCAPGGRRSGT